MEYVPNWRPPSNQPTSDICFAISNEALRLVSEQMPDLVELFPFRRAFSGVVHLDEGWLAIIIEFRDGPGVPTIGKMSDTEAEVLRQFAAHSPAGNYEELHKATGPKFFSFKKFSYVGPWKDQRLSWPHLAENLLSWINMQVLPEVLRHNQARVLRAIPQPPQYNFLDISKALWVLECEESHRQGTAFFIREVGLVTCSHVLGPKTKAFKADKFNIKYTTTIVAQEAAIDLAILKIESQLTDALPQGRADHLKQMDHLAICGYPNYRLGDTGTIVPGFVVGFRTFSGIRRILTNAPIIAGVSGSPVLDAASRVIGVAVTGTDRMEDSQKTEDHGIIPIEAIQFLHRAS